MEAMRRYTAAVVQMDSGSDKGENLRKACAFIDEAAAGGAKLICFPELMNLMGRNTGEGGGRETVPGYTTERLTAKAREHGVYIHSGSFYELVPGEKRAANTSVLIDPEGRVAAKYQKIHTFDGVLRDGTSFAESERIRPGNRIVTAGTALGKLGMSICYDIRFPELYTIMASQGAQVFFIPSSFTRSTGDHWEILLRARAVENFCYVIAPDQTGRKSTYLAHGNSMIIDPWGSILARAGDEEGVIFAGIDLDAVEDARALIPSLQNRRADVYELTANPV